MKRKLLFVIDNLQFGGGERVFSQLINGLSPDKYDLFLASHPGEPLSGMIEHQARHLQAEMEWLDEVIDRVQNT